MPDEMRHALADMIRVIPIPGRLVPPANWHITLRYLGRVDEPTYERFLHGLEPARGTGAFRIGLDGLGAFPNPGRAAVVWLGVGSGAEQLATLNHVAEEAALDAGLIPEDRPFHPHLTLSRVRPPGDATAALTHAVSVGWRCDRVVVYLSRHGKGGAIYEPLETYPLER
jgi:2'-5' RNA ligase